MPINRLNKRTGRTEWYGKVTVDGKTYSKKCDSKRDALKWESLTREEVKKRTGTVFSRLCPEADSLAPLQFEIPNAGGFLFVYPHAKTVCKTSRRVNALHTVFLKKQTVCRLFSGSYSMTSATALMASRSAVATAAATSCSLSACHVKHAWMCASPAAMTWAKRAASIVTH